jgi:serine/threonine protein kinase
MSSRAHHPADPPGAEFVAPELVSSELAAPSLASEAREKPELTSDEVVSPDLGAEEAVAGQVETAEAPTSSGPVIDVSEIDLAEEELSEQELARAEPEVGAEELERLADSPLEGAAAGAAFEAPWVDEVPDPVTPYEQRISETVKVADLPPAEQLRGRVLANRYLAEEVAEQTAVSVSYRAYHLALDRAVTVRILPRGLACSDETCQEVRRVASAASALNHPNIAATLDFGVLSDGWPYVVTEHFQGQTLAVLLGKEGKFVLRRVLHVGKQLAAGLSAAHEAGLIHGLFNPDNVLVIEPGTPAEVPTILGFGISRARGATPGPPRSGVFGVPFYVSPEQAACRPLDARSDVYSLGVVLYELMTGGPPFSDGDFAGVLCQHLDDEAAPPSSRLRAPGALAKAMDAIIQRCLRKDPAKRYQTAAELRDDLVRLEAAAARTKRRPMPEVQRPTTTIHSPAPKAEGTAAPGAKVIVHGDSEDDAPTSSPRADEPSSARSAAARSSARHAAADEGMSLGARAQAGQARTGSRPPRVDQATIKISAVDRELILAQRASVLSMRRGTSGGLQGLRNAFVLWARRGGAWLVGVVRRLMASDTRGNDSPDA